VAAVLRTRTAPGLAVAVRWSFRLCLAGLALLAAGLLARQRLAATLGLGAYAAGAGVALGPFARTMARRPPRSAAAWMLAAGMAWFALALLADLAALAGSRRVVDLDGRLGWLLPVVAVGFVLQVLAGALTYLLPTVWGRGAFGNRRLTRVLEAGWRLRVAALNIGVALLAGGRLVTAGRLLVGLALGGFLLLAGAALAWRVVEDVDPDRRSGRA
jgi:nitrite reductase (NO-forming)